MRLNKVASEIATLLSEERTHKGEERGILCPPSTYCLILCTERKGKQKVEQETGSSWHFERCQGRETGRRFLKRKEGERHRERD